MNIKSGRLMLGTLGTSGLLSSLLAPWTKGVVVYLQTTAVGTFVQFPEGYSDVLLAGTTTAIIWAAARVRLHMIEQEAQQEAQ